MGKSREITADRYVGFTAVSDLQSDTHEYKDLQSVNTSTLWVLVVNRGLQIPFSIVADCKSATTSHNEQTSAMSEGTVL